MTEMRIRMSEFHRDKERCESHDSSGGAYTTIRANGSSGSTGNSSHFFFAGPIRTSPRGVTQVVRGWCQNSTNSDSKFGADLTTGSFLFRARGSLGSLFSKGCILNWSIQSRLHVSFSISGDPGTGLPGLCWHTLTLYFMCLQSTSSQKY